MKKYIYLVALLFLLSSCANIKNQYLNYKESSQYKEYLSIKDTLKKMNTKYYILNGKKVSYDEISKIFWKNMGNSFQIIDSSFSHKRLDGIGKWDTLFVESRTFIIYKNIPNEGAIVQSWTGNGSLIFINNVHGVEGAYLNRDIMLISAGLYTYKTRREVLKTIYKFNRVTDLEENNNYLKEQINIVKLLNNFNKRYEISFIDFEKSIRNECKVDKDTEVPPTYEEFKEKCMNK